MQPRRTAAVYAKLRADHRALLRKIDRFDATGSAGDARALLSHVVNYLPAHAAMEEAYEVSGCHCEEHPVFHRIALEGLAADPVMAAAILVRLLRRHVAAEETAWALEGR
ncbi:MAG: hypothetical protein GY769_20240 [bacterium]|nr:hypothetical protein [bacterium]